MDAQQTTFDKSYLMHVIDKILKARQGSIKVLKESCLCNVRVVSRAAKDTKDPSPLASTMIAITTKYPIRINTENARKYNLPSQFIGGDDSRVVGYKQCKLSAIDWWIERSKVPDKDCRDIIDVLSARCNQEVEDYYSIDWNAAKVSQGSTIMERKMVATQQPIVKLPRHLRIPAIMQTLVPQLVTPYDEIPPYALGRLLKLRDLSLTLKMPFASQARMLLENLDPKVRLLPCTPGCSDFTGPFRYAIQQNYFTITNIGSRREEKSDEVKVQLYNFANVFTRAAQDGINTDILADIAYRTKLTTNTLMEVLRNDEIEDTIYVIYLKAQLGMPISQISSVEGTIFSPRPSKVKPTLRTNLSKFKFKEYLGLEVVDYKNGETRGQFIHDGSVLNEIIINFTSITETTATIFDIANYCRWDWAITRGQSKRAVELETKSKLIKKIENFIGIRKPQLISIINNHKLGRSGKVRFELETEYNPGQKVTMRYVSPRYLVNDNSQTIEIPEADRTPLYPTISVPRGDLDDYLDPIRRIRAKVFFYMNSFKIVRRCISSDHPDWKWKNKPIMEIVPENMRVNLSTASRMLSIMLERNMGESSVHFPHLCFLYCFCHSTSLTEAPPDLSLKYEIPGLGLIDLTAGDGLLKYDNEGNQLVIAGQTIKLENDPIADLAPYLPDYIDGYQLSTKILPALQVRSMRYLVANKVNIPCGEMFKTYVNSRAYMATRTDEITLATGSTIMRQIRVINEHPQRGIQAQFSALKRRFEQREEEDPLDFIAPYAKKSRPSTSRDSDP